MINEVNKKEANNQENCYDNKYLKLITNSDDCINNNTDKENNDNNNNINNRYINLNELYREHKKQKEKKMLNLLGSEEIFINRQKQIQIIKQRNELLHLKKINSFININNNMNSNNEQNNVGGVINDNNNNVFEDNMFSLNDYKNFEYSIINIGNEIKH